MIWLLFLNLVLAATPLNIGQCKTDGDCLSYTTRLQNLPTDSKQISNAGYSCISGSCSYVVSSGSICRKATDCSTTDLLPSGYSLSNLTALQNDVCSADACTIASSCESNYVPFGALPSGPQLCCRGLQANEPCLLPGSQVDTCGEKTICTPSSNLDSSAFICTLPTKSSSQTIGIILTLIAAAMSNLGLNLQKYAHRKRYEKKLKKKQEGPANRFNAFKITLANLMRSEGAVEEVPISDRSSSHTRVLTITTDDKDKLEFQPTLDFANLAKNPRWWLGFIVFAIGTFINFAALQFAPQSLIGPLGSFALVINVIVAPWLNGEKWTWKDIIGVLLIVIGSSVVVVFSGISDTDYNLCVLLKLFAKPATIVFLVVTCTLIAIIFSTIVVVEKNLDFNTEGEMESGGLDRVDEEEEEPHIIAVLPVNEEIEVTLEHVQLDVHGAPLRNKTDRKDSVTTFRIPEPTEVPVVEEAGFTDRIKEKLLAISFFKQLSEIKLVPRLKTKISLQSGIVKYGLPFSYASLGGLMATLLTLFAKATIHLLTTSFQGSNQFTSFSAYLFSFITVFCALSQIYWINLGLARYDALLQIPVFYVIWTLFDVIGGGIYYDEFAGFTAFKFGIFSLGVSIIFAGVVVLAGRLKAIAEDDKITTEHQD